MPTAAQPFDPAACADELRKVDDGLWASKRIGAISYPTGGNAACHQVEDDSFWFSHRNECILAVLERFPPGGVLVDVGGGNGYVARAIQRAGIPAALVEPGSDGVANARRRGIEVVVHATLEDAAFHDHCLPAIGAFDVIEHMADARGFLKNVERVLSPGGRFYATVPAYAWLWSSEDEHAGHHRRYTLQTLRAEVEAAGLDVEYATYLFQPLVLPVLLLRALPSRLGLRRGGGIERNQGEHRAGGGVVAKVLASRLRHELEALRAGQSLRWGSSCLVVCRAGRPRSLE